MQLGRPFGHVVSEMHLARRRPANRQNAGMDRETFIHPRALVESDRIGAGTRIWAFAHVMPGATIGRDCNVCDHTYIEGDVVIGDRVTVKSGVYLWDGLRIEDDVFLGPQATFTNDPFPRSRQPFELRTTTVHRGASIGAGAVILPGLSIGEGAMVGAGAVLTSDAPAFAVMVGNPARVLRELTPTRDSPRL